jgi:diguanylate cyclase
LIWVTVDQARELRRTHGGRAVEAMLEKMEHSFVDGLKPAEEIGRWGDDEFLILSHERNLALLLAHTKKLAGMARTTDFRWWGDRVTLTVSAGVAWAEPGERLSELLDRAQVAMVASIHAGGNQVTSSPGRTRCSQS